MAACWFMAWVSSIARTRSLCQLVHSKKNPYKSCKVCVWVCLDSHLLSNNKQASKLLLIRTTCSADHLTLVSEHADSMKTTGRQTAGQARDSSTVSKAKFSAWNSVFGSLFGHGLCTDRRACSIQGALAYRLCVEKAAYGFGNNRDTMESIKAQQIKSNLIRARAQWVSHLWWTLKSTHHKLLTLRILYK